MTDPWASYDRWLESPYTELEREEPDDCGPDPDDLRDRALDREYRELERDDEELERAYWFDQELEGE